MRILCVCACTRMGNVSAVSVDIRSIRRRGLFVFQSLEAIRKVAGSLIRVLESSTSESTGASKAEMEEKGDWEVFFVGGGRVAGVGR